MRTKDSNIKGRFTRHQRKVLHLLADVLQMPFVDVVTEVRRDGMLWFLSRHRPVYPVNDGAVAGA